MNISEPFIKRPIATSLLAAAVLLAGAVGYTQLPVAPLPRTDFPTLSVTASLPGASPETMASSVATPLERRFGRIAGVTEITSSSNLGSTTITLQFDLNRNVDAAARDVQAAIAAAGAELPTNLPFRPSYRKVNPADAPIMIVALSSDTVPLPQVFDAAISILAQKISQVPGVGQVTVGGGQQPAVRVQVDPEALAGVGLSLEDVRNMLAATTVDQPKGSLGGSSQVRSIDANDQLFGAAAYKNLMLSYSSGAAGASAIPVGAAGAGTLSSVLDGGLSTVPASLAPNITGVGSAVRLSDVADVFDDVENNLAAAWTNGRRSVLLIIRRQPGANIIQTNEGVKAVLPALMASIPAGIQMQVSLDRTQTVRASVHDTEMTLVLSVLLVVLVVFLFLRSPRATAVPSVAVPLSIVGTFAVMWMLDYSLDNLSLMALTISTGFVVDDAIVVTENITRFIEMGDSPMDAALKGAKQIGFTIVSITLSLLAVFIPILMMGGVVGRLFREFAVTLSVAIAISAVVSLTLTPTLSSILLKSEKPTGKFHEYSERFFAWLVSGYGRGLDWVLDHGAVMLLFVGAAMGLTVYLFITIPKGLFPQQDTGFISGFSEAPQDVSFASMYERQEAVNAVVASDPDVLNVNAFIGSNSGSANVGSAFMELKPLPPRKTTVDEVINRLRGKLRKVMGINLFLQAGQDLRIGGRNARTQYQYTLQSANLEELKTWAPKVLDRLRKVSDLRDVNSDQQTAGLQLDIAIDRDTASRLGITPLDIDNTLYDAYGQRQVATTYTQLNQYRVVMEVKPAFLATPNALDRIYVKSNTGALVPLGAVTHHQTGAVPLAVNHQGQFPSITLSFNLAPGKSLSDAVKSVRQSELDIGMPPSIKASFSGTAQAFQDSLTSQPFLIAFALFTVYIVLGVLYESYVHPVTILSTLPTAGVGALLTLIIFHTEFTVIALVGIILLIGIVKKNAIMMIDFAIEAERDQGMTTRQAIKEASMLRFRPILMTTLAAILGGLPLALGSGMGSELRRPLGISIVGGLIFSQVFTLYTTPVIYLAMDRFSRNKHKQIKTKTESPQPG